MIDSNQVLHDEINRLASRVSVLSKSYCELRVFSDKEIDSYFELTNSPIIVHALRISNGFNHHKKEEPKKEQKEAGKEEKVEEAQG